MAKRFTDTGLGRKAWFRKLEPRLKCAWRFLTEECDVAGVWSIDMDALSFHVGEQVQLDELIKAVNADGSTRLVRIDDDKLFLTKFVVFQYGELSPDCKPHKPVMARLEELNLLKGYRKGFQTLKDKEKEKDKDKEKEKEREDSFEALWKIYPRRDDKAEARVRFDRLIKSESDLQALTVAIQNYRDACASKQTETKYIKHFASFLGTEKKERWRDWVNPEQSDDFSQTTGEGFWNEVFGGGAT